MSETETVTHTIDASLAVCYENRTWNTTIVHLKAGDIKSFPWSEMDVLEAAIASFKSNNRRYDIEAVGLIGYTETKRIVH